jgi:hypothetical protein
MATYTLKKLKTYDAHGGLSNDLLDDNPSLKAHEYSSTRAGRYVIHSIAKHVSGSRWLYSSIAWGTPITFNWIEHRVYVKKDGKFVKLSEYNSQWKRYADTDLYDELLRIYQNNYMNYYTKPFPDTWVFNDFGHVSIKYFKDTNNNFMLDKKESIQSDFIHTTPVDEAKSSYNKIVEPRFATPITLGNSHGCIHVKPDNINELIDNGYLSKGGNIEIHEYKASLLIPNTLEIKNANPKKMFEVHFFPQSNKTDKKISGKGQLVVYSINKKGK